MGNNIKSVPYVFKVSIGGQEFSRKLESINALEAINGFDGIETAEKWINNNCKGNEQYVILNIYTKP